MLSLAATQMSHKLWFSSSTFGNPQRFPICAARPPHGVARAVGVGAAPLPLRLGLTLLPFPMTQASHKPCFRICAARLPQAVGEDAHINRETQEDGSLMNKLKKRLERNLK